MRFEHALVLLLISVLHITDRVDAVLWPCESSAACTAFVAEASCSVDGNCECPVGKVFSQDVTQCLTESLYGEACQEGVQCSHMLTGAYCNGNGICSCQDGLTYLRGRCRALVPLYGDCNEDEDCFFSYDREAVVCRDRKCQCANGFYQRSENICRRILMNAGDVCTVDADCQGGPNHKCTSGRCQDTETKDASVQTTKELFQGRDAAINTSFVIDIEDDEWSQFQPRVDPAKVGDECLVNGEDCDGLKYSVCKRNRCYCKMGYYPRNGMCMAELGEVAADSSFCEASSVTFRNGKCTCLYDQFNMPDMRTCVKNVAQVNFICTQESQCSPFGESYCSPVSPRRCLCRDYATYDDQMQMCTKKQGLGRYCEKNEDCEGLENTSCNTANNVCGCKENYTEVNEKCRPSIGGGCESTEECLIKNSECVEEPVEVKEKEREVENKYSRRVSLLSKVIEDAQEDQAEDDETEELVKKCQCKDKYVNYMNQCLEVAEKYGDPCTETEQCKPLLGDLSKCTDNRCVCEEESQFNYGKCAEKRDLGEQCSKVSDCFVEEDKEKVQCRNAVCQCEFGYVQDGRRCISTTTKGSSGRPSPLKVITLLLISAAVLVTSAAIKEAYYDRQH